MANNTVLSTVRKETALRKTAAVNYSNRLTEWLISKERLIRLLGGRMPLVEKSMKVEKTAPLRGRTARTFY